MQDLCRVQMMGSAPHCDAVRHANGGTRGSPEVQHTRPARQRLAAVSRHQSL